MALLLCGTILGLYSYYVTMITLRAKFQEKTAAEQVKSTVGEMIAPDNITDLLHGKKPLNTLRKVNQAIDAYAEKLEFTVSLRRDPLNGEDEEQKMENLRE